jgi:hypothetical protein
VAKEGGFWDSEKVTPSESGKGGRGQWTEPRSSKDRTAARVSLGDRLRQRDTVGVASILGPGHCAGQAAEHALGRAIQLSATLGLATWQALYYCSTLVVAGKKCVGLSWPSCATPSRRKRHTPFRPGKGAIGTSTARPPRSPGRDRICPVWPCPAHALARRDHHGVYLILCETHDLQPDDLPDHPMEIGLKLPSVLELARTLRGVAFLPRKR